MLLKDKVLMCPADREQTEVAVMEEQMKKNGRRSSVPIWEKYALTITQAAEYFGIGERKLRDIIDQHEDAGFVLMNGDRRLIKVLFENFLNETSAI